MPDTPMHTGVYVEEVSSAAHTIAGAPTSVTAFIGRASRGPVEQPVKLNSFADFKRIFGGLWLTSPLGYAVRDFFYNGGSRALIVRLHNNAVKATAPGGFEAASVGAWANMVKINVQLEREIGDDKPPKDKLTLWIYDGNTGLAEEFSTLVPANPSARVNQDFLADLREELEKNSSVVRISAQAAFSLATTKTPSESTLFLAGGSDGDSLDNDSITTGLSTLEKADNLNLLCIPPEPANDFAAALPGAAHFCEQRRAMLIVDPPAHWFTVEDARNGLSSLTTLGKNAAVFFPRLCQPNPLNENQIEEFAPCGAVAGVIARTDAERGVWKAPAGIDAALRGVLQLSVALNDAENGLLNPLGVNCLRVFPAIGAAIWGARTLAGNDQLASEWKYIPVRRLTLFLEESIYRGLQWVVFESNGERLWSQIRQTLGAFMQNMFRQGAFRGTTPEDAYFVKCDRDTMMQDDLDNQRLHIVIGFAPVKPAEFVICKISLITGQVVN